ncbi:MAG: hypothetical protein RLZZ479_251 [Bacteroidota bacterium]|jgi:hypothetical protein
MNLEVFKEVVECLKKQEELFDAFYKLGIDSLNFIEPLQKANSHLIGAVYGKEGKDIFEWWCYDKKWGTRKDLQAFDADGKVICESIEDLWQYLEKNATWDYELTKK